MAPVTEHQGSFLSRISRRNQIVSMDVNHEQELEELEDFQKHISDRFTELLLSPSTTTAADSPESDPILSIQWLRKLLDAFMSLDSVAKKASLKLENVKNKGLLQIRTNPPSPQCFSDNRPASLKALRSKTTEKGGMVEEMVKRKEEEEAEEKSKEARGGLDVLWFLKPCTMSN